MSRKQLVILVVAVVIVGAAISARFAALERVTLCHRPPGNTGHAQTIIVAFSAAPRHFAHDDRPGACPASPSR